MAGTGAGVSSEARPGTDHTAPLPLGSLVVVATESDGASNRVQFASAKSEGWLVGDSRPEDDSTMPGSVMQRAAENAGSQSGELVEGTYIVKKDYLYSYAENSWRILTGPLRYDRADWINVGIVVGIVGALFLIDEVLDRRRIR